MPPPSPVSCVSELEHDSSLRTSFEILPPMSCLSTRATFYDKHSVDLPSYTSQHILSIVHILFGIMSPVVRHHSRCHQSHFALHQVDKEPLDQSTLSSGDGARELEIAPSLLHRIHPHVYSSQRLTRTSSRIRATMKDHCLSFLFPSIHLYKTRVVIVCFMCHTCRHVQTKKTTL